MNNSIVDWKRRIAHTFNFSRDLVYSLSPGRWARPPLSSSRSSKNLMMASHRITYCTTCLMHSTGHKESKKIHNIYARMSGAFVPRALRCRSTLPDLPEAATMYGLHGRVDTGRFGRRDQLMRNGSRTVSGRPYARRYGGRSHSNVFAIGTSPLWSIRIITSRILSIPPKNVRLRQR